MSNLQTVYRISSPIKGNLGEYASKEQAVSAAGNTSQRLGIVITVWKVEKEETTRFHMPYTKEDSVFVCDVYPAMAYAH